MSNDDRRSVNPIYLVTVFETILCRDVLDNAYTIADLGDIRSVGFSHSFDIAERTVLENICNINESCYDYAVIEKIYPELYPYPISDDRCFYKFNHSKNVYEPIDEPVELIGYAPIGGIG